MNKTVRTALLVSALLYVCSFATCLVGHELHPLNPTLEIPEQTIWDYVGNVLLLFAIGSTIAAYRLAGEDETNE